MNELWTITEVGFGLRDTQIPMLWFVAEKERRVEFIFVGDEALKFIKDYNIRNIQHLDRMKCLVKVDGSGVHFIGL